MNSTQRHELYVKLMCSGPALDHPEDYKELAEMAVEDTERLEPLIDSWLKQAELDGRLKALLEVAHWQQVPIMKLKEKIECQFTTTK